MAPLRSADAPAIPRGDECILLVEDEAMLRRTATRLLEKLGYRVVTAQDGVEALDLLAARGREVQLIMSDAMMPRLSGTQLLQRLRDGGSRVPFIIASGHAASELGELPADAALRFLPKPWAVHELAQVVREALDDAA